MKKLKFLHEKTPNAQKTEFIAKGRMQEYGRERYQKRLKKKEEDEKSGFVTKSMFELQFGWKDSGGWTVSPNRTYRKYIDKYEYFRGNHTQKERR
jgi:hypothetical protein